MDPQLPQSIGKALLVLSTLTQSGRSMRLTELSMRTGLAKSTTHRMLTALTSSGLVVRVGNHYLPQHVSAVPSPTPDSRCGTLRRLAPFLGDLLLRTGMTAGLAVLDGTNVNFMYRVYSHGDVRSSSDDTGSLPAHLSTAGRLLLAYDRPAARILISKLGLDICAEAELGHALDRIRQAGLAESRSERSGTLCLAAPVRLPGRPVVAFTIRGKSGQVDRTQAQHWLRRVSETAMRAMLTAA